MVAEEEEEEAQAPQSLAWVVEVEVEGAFLMYDLEDVDG